VQEVGRAVERVDVPAMALVGTFDDPAFFHDEAEIGAGLLQGVAQDLLGLPVRGRDEIARTLARDLEILNLPEVALEGLLRLHHGVGHHGHQGRADHRLVLGRAGKERAERERG
jgi:hypothetical protein